MIARASHLGEHLVQPLEGPMQVHFDPARGGGDVLPVILGSPALHKAHPVKLDEGAKNHGQT